MDSWSETCAHSFLETQFSRKLPCFAIKAYDCRITQLFRKIATLIFQIYTWFNVKIQKFPIPTSPETQRKEKERRRGARGEQKLMWLHWRDYRAATCSFTRNNWELKIIQMNYLKY